MVGTQVSELDFRIDFSTNAKAVEQQIKALNKEVQAGIVGQARLDAALRGGKASARALTGDLSAKKAILKLDKQIDALAVKRMKTATAGYKWANAGQERYVKGLVKTNEVLRIQRKIMDDNATAMINMGKNTQWAGRQLVVGFTVPLTIAAGAAMKAFSDLEKELIRFKRVYGDAFTSTDDLNAATKAVKALATEWTKYGVAVSDTIDLAAEAAGAGFMGEQLTAQINNANKIAVLGELDKQKAMKATIALQSTFKMSNEELSQSIDFLNQLENQTMVTMDDMTTAIPKAATVVEGLGGSIKDLGVFMAAMAEGGVTAAEGANALKSGLGSLLNPSKKAKEELASIGIVLSDLWAQSEKNGGGVMYVIEQMSASLEKLGQTQKQMVIEELFGKHQFARMNALLSNINKGNQALQAKGVAQTGQLEAALISQRELGKLGESNLTKFQAAIERLKASIAPLGEVIMGVVTPIIEFVTKLIDKFNNMPDIVQKMILGFTALGGIVAPLFLMLLGQVQNLIGNGMKFVNWIRNWGKETHWINAENLTLADTLSKVDAQLIAENNLLAQNTQAWKTRGTAAAASAGFGLPGRKKFAKGGNVPGTGNTDSVPALLTPGEFVVNKKASRRFGGLLNAINSGNVPGYSDGGEVGYHWAHMTPSRNMWNSDFSTMPPSAQKKVGTLIESLYKLGIDPANAVTFMSNLTRQMPDNINAGLSGTSGVPLSSLLKQFNPRRVSNKNQPMAQALWSGGMHRNKIIGGDYVGSAKVFDILMSAELRSFGTKRITDPQLYQATRTVIDQMGRMGGKDGEFAAYLARADSQIGNVRLRNAGGVAARASAAGMPIESLGMRSGSRGFKLNPIFGRRSYRSFGKNTVWQKLFTRFADGGTVPGTGNEDTVPAMLTPGESVINKRASKQFGPLLEAINSGRIKMLSQGEIGVKDKGYRGALDSAARRGLLDEARAELENFLIQFQQMFKLSEKELQRTRKIVTADLDKQTRASHVVPMFDENGKKIYDDRLLVGATARENQGMLDLSKANAQSVMKTIAAQGKNAAAIEARTQVLSQLANQEHIVVREQRDLLQEMIMEAQQLKRSNPDLYNQLPPSLRGKQGMAFGATLSTDVNSYATGKPLTAAEVAAIRAIPGVGPKGPGGENSDYSPVGKSSKGMMALSMAPMAFMMFGDMLTGTTEKMGKFGDSVNAAMNALFAMSMMSNMLPQGAIGKVAGKWGLGGVGKAVGGSKIVGGLKGALGKYGLGAKGIGLGAAIGIGGNFLAGKISDGNGGARDFAGSATKYGSIGAGIGMLFGPLGAGIGAAAGALVGLAVQARANTKELEKATQAMRESAIAYSKIGKELEDRYQIGGGITANDLIAGVAGMSEEQAQLHEQLMQDMMSEDSVWKKRIDDLATAQKKGLYGGASNELNMLTMQLRGQGVDEQSVEVITKAFAASLPEALRGAINPATFKPMSTDQIIDSVNIQDVIAAAATLSSAFEATQLEILNLDRSASDYDEQLAKLTERAAKASNGLKDVEIASGRSADFFKTAGAAVTSLISTNQGNGLSHEEWLNIQKGFHGNQAELAYAASVLVQAGHDLSNAAGEQIIGQFESYKQQALAQQRVDELTAKQKQISDDQQALKEAKSTRNSDINKNAGKIALEESGKALNIKAANLQIEQISLEKQALAKFTKQFNKAFGTSIDSFADAQYQINKLGNRIQRIQVKVIAPLQEKIDDMNRENELAQRRLDELEEKKQKRIDAINAAYDKQIDALKKIREQNEFIFNQQQNAVDMADALAKGDVAGAVNAMVESNRNVANYTGTFAEQALQDQKDAALANDPYNKEKTALELEIEERNKRILAIEDQIYNINEKQVEPLQRRSDLMSLMLETSQLALENQKANAMGLDAENFARQQALQSAKEALYNAQNEKTTRDEIIERFREQRRQIKANYGEEMNGVKNVEAKLNSMMDQTIADMETASNEVEFWGKAAEEFGISTERGIAALNTAPKQGSMGEAIQRVLNYVDPEGKTREKIKNVPVRSPSNPAENSVFASQVYGDKAFGGKGAYMPFGGEGAINPNYLGAFGDQVIENLATDPAFADNVAEQTAKGVDKSAAVGVASSKSSSTGGGPVSGNGVNRWTNGKGYLGAKWYQSGNWTWAGGHHNGIDVVGVGTGTRVVATRGGQIVHSGYGGSQGGWAGNNVIQDIGGGTKLVFAHLSRAVASGRIKAGDTIGYTGNTGRSFGAHLHVSAMKGGTYVNPTQFLNSGGMVAGIGNWDKVPAMLTPGEFVLNKAAVSTIGTAPLRDLNSGKIGTRPMPTGSAQTYHGGDEVVYNEFNLSFDIREASDANEVANIVLTKINNSTRSRVRNR